MVHSGADRTGTDWAAIVRSKGPAAAVAVPILFILAVAIWTVWPLLAASRSGPDPGATTWIAAANDRLTRLPGQAEPAGPAAAAGGIAPQGARQYGLDFDRAEVPQGPLAIYAPWGGGGELFANRVPLPAERRTWTPSPVLLDRGAIVAFPREHLHPGPNRADLVVEAGQAVAWPRTLLFGPEPVLAQAHARQAWVHRLAPRIALLTGAAALFAAVCLALLQPGRARWETWRPAAFTALATVYATLALQAQAGLPAGVLWAQADLLPAMLALFLAAWLAGRDPDRWTRTVLRFGALALAAVALIDLALQVLDRHSAVSTVIALAVTAIAATAAAWRVGLRRPADLAASLGAALAILWLLAAVLCRSTLLPPIGDALAETVAATSSIFLLAGALVVFLERGLAEAFALWERRRSLSTLVREQRLLILEQESIIGRELQRRAVLEERERLTRDIHDGIGGQLLSLLVRIRAGKIGQAELEAEVQSSLNDLRLIVDSLDHAAESFPAALAVVHSRLRPPLEAAGVTLHWRQDDGALPQHIEARTALNIFRILQEAFANVLKHSGADRVEVEIRAAAGGGLVVSIADNGSGMGQGPGRPRGRGLGNMRQRALRIGGSLDVGLGIGGKGVGIRLELPGGGPTPT